MGILERRNIEKDMTIHLTTFFDINYLSRGLTLIHSIKENHPDFSLHLLCLDDETYKFFNNNKEYPEIIVLKLGNIESFYPELVQCKEDRSTIEYFFTLSPFLPLYILEKYNLSHICSLDADMKFYSSPEPIFNYLDNYSVIITPHKFSKENQSLTTYGKYNVSFQIFKNDESGLKCLKRWKEQCTEWCKDSLDTEGRFADQKYLDFWQDNFPNKVLSLDDENCGLAVWNLNNYNIEFKKNRPTANNKEIIFYHFHHFKILNKHLALNGFFLYKAKATKGNVKLYLDYWKSLKKWDLPYSTRNNIRDAIYNLPTIRILEHEKSFFIFYLKNIFQIPDVRKTNNFFKKILWRISLK